MNFLKSSWAYKRILIMLGLIFIVTGCASYKYELASDPYKGYVVKRNDYLIPEYTIDIKNQAPSDLKLAQQRFKRRHSVVEDYYKRMERIENQFKTLILDYPLSLVTMMTVALRLPFILISDYRYDHNPKYREKIDKRDEARDKKEEERLQSLQTKLNKFIESDLAKEGYSEDTQKAN